MIDFGFEFTPFGVTPDPQMVFRHRQFDEAYAALESAIANGKGFIVITGEIGAGKTTLMRTFLAAEHPGLHTAAILNTGLDADGLLRSISDDLGIPPEQGRDRKAIIDAISEHLLSAFSSGKQTAIFIDEAQHLSFEALEVLRMLSNLETDRDKLVQIVLFGQEALRETLARPDLLQLRSRVAVHRHLKPLTIEETQEYIQHRLTAAGASTPVSFAPAAIKKLHAASGGLPRRINILADIALQAAAESDSTTVDIAHVKRAITQFSEMEPESMPKVSAARTLQLALSWGVLAVVIVLVILKFGQHPAPAPQPSMTPTPRMAASVAAPPAPIPPDGAAMALFLRSYQIDPLFTPAAMTTVLPEALAERHGRVWVRIPAKRELLSAVGLPALVRIGGVGSSQLAVLARESDSSVRISTADGENVVDWELVALDDAFPASILLPHGAPTGFLQEGEHGDAVVSLQNALFRAASFPGVVNGIYGPTTTTAVRKFQEANRLPIDGLAGPWTIGALARMGYWTGGETVSVGR